MNIKEKRRKILHLESQIKTLINKYMKVKPLKPSKSSERLLINAEKNIRMLLYFLQIRMFQCEIQIIVAQPTKE